jgi:ribonuclease P protein component
VAGDRTAHPEADTPATPASEALALAIIRKRADFVAANHGVRVARPGFVLLVKPVDAVGADSAKPAQVRFGVTVTRKIGNAVARNRMKRRFRALLRDMLPHQGVAGADHVLIGREGGIERDFAKLRTELEAALARIAAGKGDPPRKPRPNQKSGGKSR